MKPKLQRPPHWSARLRERLRALGMTGAELSRRTGISDELIRKYIQGKVDNPRNDVLPILAGVLNVSPIWLEHGVSLTHMAVPLLGYVGAGERFIPDDRAAEVLQINAEALDLFAATVRGNSGLPVYKPGEIVVASRAAGLRENAFLQCDCVVTLVTGEAYLKKVIRGGTLGTYTLISYNDAPIENATIEWAAPVVMVLRNPGLLLNR